MLEINSSSFAMTMYPKCLPP